MILHPYIKYRSDIDGLRALAVFSVILFHINKNWISGGFLGVDIFFVISGYLITLILTKEVDKTGKISITNFYKRRIKRILPALLFVLIPTFVTGFILMAPDDLLNLSKSMIWSIFSAANIYFYSSIDTGYFAAGSSDLPLLHLWSLGVEEQFYILWPFAVLILLKYINTITQRLLLAIILFAGSLSWAQATIVVDHSFAYYMLFTRAWELLAGAIVALLLHAGFKTKNSINEFMAITGLILVILSLIFVTESDPVPGLAALPVILGASLLILSGVSYKTYVGRLLSFKLFVAIGLVSYSAYLWHWPILAFLRYALIDIDLTMAVLVIIVTFALATFSYLFIESPLRKNNVSTKNVFLWYFIVPAFTIVLASTITIQAITYKSNFIFPWEKLKILQTQTLPAYAYKYNCQYSIFNVHAYQEKRCVYPEKIKKANAILIGDSNAAHYLGMLRVFAKRLGFSLRNATQSSCPPVFNSNFKWVSPKYQKGCSLYTHTIENIAEQFDTVIIGGSWDQYYNKKGFNKSFKKTIARLSKKVKHIILLEKVPIMPGYNKECEIRAIKIKDLNCTAKFNNTLPNGQFNKFIKDVAKQYSNVDYFDIRHKLCKDKVCSPYLNGIPVYFNAGHLSMYGSELIGEKMILENDPTLHVFEHLRHQHFEYSASAYVKDMGEIITVTVKPVSLKAEIAFYLYKNGKRIDTQWYRESNIYILNKKKLGHGKYKIRFFIKKRGSKTKEIEEGYSDTIIF